jgi:hypothetical protein
MKYEIRRKMVDDKHQLIFFLSVVTTLTGTSAIWSTHRYEGDKNAKIEDLKPHFQSAHDRQIDFIIEQEFLNEPDEFKQQTVQDITQQDEKHL